MSNESAPTPNSESTPTPEINDQPSNFFVKNWHFLAGFLGWYIVNGLYWTLTLGRQTIWQYAGDNFMILLPTFCVNLFALVILSMNKTTRKIGYGILVAIAVNLAIATVLGVADNAWCFYPFFANQ